MPRTDAASFRRRNDGKEERNKRGTMKCRERKCCGCQTGRSRGCAEWKKLLAELLKRAINAEAVEGAKYGN
jgi:hypothetical protein